MTKTIKQKQKLHERKDAVLLLRFHTTTPKRNPVRFATYQFISEFTRLTYGQVEHICRYAEATAGLRKKHKSKLRVYDEEHIAFLTDQKTMELWAGKTGKERCVLFHRQFPNKRLALTTLRRIYAKHMIKRKKVRQQKHLPGNYRANYAARCKKVLEQVDRVKEEGLPIVYADEICFTKRAMQSREYSCKNSNLTIDQGDYYSDYRAVICAITAERGLVHQKLFASAVNDVDFGRFVRKLHAKMGARPFALFVDNLHAHKHRDVLEIYQELSVSVIYNVGYSPQFNPIESTFSLPKARYGRVRLHHHVNNKEFKRNEEIRKSLQAIKQAHCDACVKKSYHLL